MNMISRTGIKTNTNVRLDYDLRLKAGIYGLNISEIARDALKAEIDRLEQIRC